MPSQQKRGRILVALLLSGLAFTGAGCARRSAHAAPPANNPPSRPVESSTSGDAAPTTAPDIQTPPSVPASTLPENTSGPNPPKPPAPHKPAPEQPAAPKPPAPQISPQMSPGDQASYERKTNEDMSEAEKNLQMATGRQLNASQTDLFGKIRSFLDLSREASKGGDWARAQNLAQKARLLSVELVNSL